MKKSKGFVFVETIVVIAVLTVALLTIYVSLSSVISNEKRRATYDDAGFIYRTYYIERFLVSLNIEDYINTYLVNNDRLIIEFNCDDLTLYDIKTTVNNKTVINTDLTKKKFCEAIINTSKLDIKHIYITKYNINELKNYTDSDNNTIKVLPKTEALKNVDSGFIYYLRTISSSNTLYENNYRLIVEYERTEYDDGNKREKSATSECPKGYALKDNTCKKEIIKDYYANVVLQPKNTLDTMPEGYE